MYENKSSTDFQISWIQLHSVPVIYMRLEMFSCWLKKYDQYIQSCIPVQVEKCRFRTNQFLQVKKRHFGSTVAGQHIYNITMTTVSLWKKVIRAANLDGGSCCAGTIKSLYSFFFLLAKCKDQTKVSGEPIACTLSFFWVIHKIWQW